MKLRVATSQFPVDRSVERNSGFIVKQMKQARDAGAHVIHFSEGSLSGYAGTDLPSFRGFDWQLLESCSSRIMELASELKLWVILGSSHRLTGRRKPHNCTYIISDRGQIVDRYDKRFCAGDRSGTSGDLAHYTPGDHSCIFEIRGVRCAALICYDYRYPELYRDYKQRGVELVFHSFHAGNIPPARLQAMQSQVGEQYHRMSGGSTYPEITMPATMQAAAAANHVWISCSNSSARYSCWPAFFVRADGVVTGRLRRHATNILVSTVNTRQRLYDSTQPWRSRAMRGVLHSGTTTRDRRSVNRTTL